jgi:histone H3/H4
VTLREEMVERMARAIGQTGGIPSERIEAEATRALDALLDGLEEFLIIEAYELIEVLRGES